MTHTLHRLGSAESLCNDHVLLIMPARGINMEGFEDRMRQAWRIIAGYADDLVNFGNLTQGNRYKTTLEKLQQVDSRLAHAVFKSTEALKRCLLDLKAAELGPSVVVSGIQDTVFDLCREIGITPHTVNLSLGIHGRVDLLPSEPVLEITTMCGHALIASGLVESKVADIKNGRKSAREAAHEMAALCECGIFNPDRAQMLLENLAGRD